MDVAPGDTVQVSLPEGSLGVGDYWGVVSVDDPSVAGADVAIGEAVFGVEPAAEGTHSTGGNQQFAVEIRGLTAGETTVRTLYCTQTRTVSQDCGKVSAARRPVYGADRVARFLLGPLTKHPEATVEPTATDDGLGFRITEHGKLDSVMVLGVRGERVTEVWLVRNLEKLTLWR